MRVGIDAINLFSGGGLTHLKNIIRHFNPNNHKIDKIIVWAKKDVLDILEDKDWLEKRTNTNINGNLISRYKWILFKSKIEFSDNCDILYSPGGLYFGSFRPYITMSRNMLLFDNKERQRLSFVLRKKLLVSRYFQIKSLKNADGTIFISEYAIRIISTKLMLDKTKYCKIHHGISDDFKKPNQQRSFNLYNKISPINVLYVSSVSFYKHQWNVIKAINLLRDEGCNIILHLVGGAEPKALKRMNATIEKHDPKRVFIKYHGIQPYKEVINFYNSADLFVYASTCENMPNILLEAMSASLPIACSRSEPMSEFLKDAGVYFNSEDVMDIKNSLQKLLRSSSLRKDLSKKASQYAEEYNWTKSSKKTFSFIESIFNKRDLI